MKYSNAFVLSILGYTAAGAPLGGFGGLSGNSEKTKKMGEYLNFLGRLGTQVNSYNDNPEFQKRLGLYEKNDEYINECNWKADHTDEKDPVHCAHNQFSDWSQEEYEAMLGLKEDKVDQGNHTEGVNIYHNGGLGIVPATTVDHTPYMTDVKNQGSCGSCWAFAATSALEGTIGLGMGDTPPRLSEQQSVDCTLDTTQNENMFGKTYGQSGCNGGWMSGSWKFMQDQGAMLDYDYPYKAKNQDCAHDKDKIYGYVKSYGQTPSNDVQKMKEKIMQQPGAVALNASMGQFRFYKSGVVKSCCEPGDTNCNEDTITINHGVVIVGYSEGGNTVRKCSVNDWWVGCEDVPDESELDTQGDTNYWKVQNSWGTGWGDQGFIKLEMSEGQGVCRVNYYGIHYADWKIEEEGF